VKFLKKLGVAARREIEMAARDADAKGLSKGRDTLPAKAVAGHLWRRTLPDLKKPTQQPEIDATRATANLPGLDIEIVHRRSLGGDAEQISIHLQAVPSFEAFGGFVESANLFAFWAQAVEMAWLPWRAAFQAMLPPGLTLPQVEATTRFIDRSGETK
jgi:hypothetical protein